uniref:C3H1-type domain-containing protein n=1 Tax=Globodera rostochiensis TaxID=31243 RepID=A0A914ICK9_GLORO
MPPSLNAPLVQTKRATAKKKEEWTASDVQSQPLCQRISGGNNIRAEERKREKYSKKDETDGWRLISVDDAIQRFEPGQNSVARAIETERCDNIVEECWENRMSVSEVEPLDEENGTTGADEWFLETKIIPLELLPADDDDDQQMQQAEFVESVADGCSVAADEDPVEPDNHWRSLDGENRTQQLLSDIGATLGVPEMTAEEKANALERCGTKTPRAPLCTEVSDNEHSKEQPMDREEEEATTSTDPSDMNYIYHQSEPEDSEDSNLIGLGSTLVTELDETHGIDSVTTHELPTENGGEEDIIVLDGDQTGQEEEQNVLPTENGGAIVVNGHQTGQEEKNVSNEEEEQEEAHAEHAEEGEIEEEEDDDEEEEEESVLPPGLFVDSSGEDNENEVSSATPQHTQHEHSLVDLTELSPSRRARPIATTALTLSPQKANSNGQDERPAVLEARQTPPTSVLSSPIREVCPTTQSPSKALQKDRRTSPAQTSVPSPRASSPPKGKRTRSKRKRSKRSATPDTSKVVNQLLNAPSRQPIVHDVPKLTANTYRRGRADPDWWLNTKQKKRTKKQKKRELERQRHKNIEVNAQLNQTAGPSLTAPLPVEPLLSTPIGMDICSPQKSPPPRPPHPIPPPPPLLLLPLPQLIESVPMPSKLFQICGRFYFKNSPEPRIPVTDVRLHPFVTDCHHLFTHGNCSFLTRCKFSHGNFEQTTGWLNALMQFKAMEESLRSPMARASKSPTASPTARSSKSPTAYSRHSNSPTARLSRSKLPKAYSCRYRNKSPKLQPVDIGPLPSQQITNGTLPPSQQIACRTLLSKPIAYGAPLQKPHQIAYGAPLQKPQQIAYGAPLQKPQQIAYGAPLQKPQQIAYGAPLQKPQQIACGAPLQKRQQIACGAPLQKP